MMNAAQRQTADNHDDLAATEIDIDVRMIMIGVLSHQLLALGAVDALTRVHAGKV